MFFGQEPHKNNLQDYENMTKRSFCVSTYPFVLVLICALFSRSFGDEVSLSFVRSQAIPNIEIDGRAAHIHTQGIFVDENHLYITGRLENEPKRPLFLRFDRKDPKRFSYIDLSIPDKRFQRAQLDHPGGFDCDGEYFWIPVAKSQPRGPSVVVKVPKNATAPFEARKPQVAYVVEDHIGAVACQPTGTLWGANWDTKQIYRWEAEGRLMERMDRDKFHRDDNTWALAVQDWKFAKLSTWTEEPLLVAGGLDKSSSRDESKPRSVVDIFTESRERISRIHVRGVEGFRGHMTNEGLCLLNGDTLCLLPADIGRDAKLYFFSVAVAKR